MYLTFTFNKLRDTYTFIKTLPLPIFFHIYTWRNHISFQFNKRLKQGNLKQEFYRSSNSRKFYYINNTSPFYYCCGLIQICSNRMALRNCLILFNLFPSGLCDVIYHIFCIISLKRGKYPHLNCYFYIMGINTAFFRLVSLEKSSIIIYYSLTR